MHYDPMTAKTLGYFILVTDDLSLLLFSTDVDISLRVQLQDPSLFLLHFILGYVSSITQPHKGLFRFWFCHARNLYPSQHSVFCQFDWPYPFRALEDGNCLPIGLLTT